MADSGQRTLAALLRLRRVETDEARRSLAEALAQEGVLADKDEAISLEIAGARRSHDAFDREVLAAWLSRMAAERTRLTGARREAETKVAAARRTLAHRRVAETAAAEALAGAKAAAETELARRDQTMLEDVSRTLNQRARAAKDLTFSPRVRLDDN